MALLYDKRLIDGKISDPQRSNLCIKGTHHISQLPNSQTLPILSKDFIPVSRSGIEGFFDGAGALEGA